MEELVIALAIVAVGLVLGGGVYAAGGAVFRRFSRLRHGLEHGGEGLGASQPPDAGAAPPRHRHFENLLLQNVACGAGELEELSTTLDPAHVTCPTCLRWLGREPGPAKSPAARAAMAGRGGPPAAA